MTALDIWRLHKELTIEQAAYLAFDQDPQQFRYDKGNRLQHVYATSTPRDKVDEGTYDHGWVLECINLREVLTKAVKAGDLPASIQYDASQPKNLEIMLMLAEAETSDAKSKKYSVSDLQQCQPIDHNKTTIPVNALVNWFDERGFYPSFFFPDREEAPDTQKQNKLSCMDTKHPRYSPKLAAAVAAWEAIASKDELRLSPKQEIIHWLIKNAHKHAKPGKEGVFANRAIKEIAKVANWNTGGGATKTPSKKT